MANGNENSSILVKYIGPIIVAGAGVAVAWGMLQTDIKWFDQEIKRVETQQKDLSIDLQDTKLKQAESKQIVISVKESVKEMKDNHKNFLKEYKTDQKKIMYILRKLK